MNCTFPRCGCSEREQCRPTPAPSVQPVRAWAVVDKNGKFQLFDCWRLKSRADADRKWMNKDAPNNAPHRVIRVEIREVSDE